MRSIRNRLSAIVAASALFATTASAQSYSHSAYLDLDSNAATGCSVVTAAGTVSGAEVRLTASVSGQPPMVTAVTRETCVGAGFGPPQAQAAGHAVGLNNGIGGADVIEWSTPLSGLAVGSGTPSRIVFVSSSANGADAVVANGVILQGFITPTIIPATGLLAVLLLIGLVLWIARRHPGFGSSMALLLLLGTGIAWAANFITDGQVGDWVGVSPRSSDPINDPTSSESSIDLVAAFAETEAGTLFLRVDVRDAQTQAPTITSANNASFTVGVAGTFTVNSTGVPTAALSIGCTPALPPSVTFTDNGNGSATLAGTPATGAANTYTCTITANNGIVPNATQPFTLTIARANTTTALTSAPSPSALGQTVTFTATVTTTSTLTPAGSVSFMDGATLLGTATLNGSGVATLMTNALTPGSHPISAVYAGNVDFNGSTSATVNQVVDPAPTTTTLMAAPNPSVFGQTVTLTATINESAPGSPTGTVTFFDGATNLGTATLAAGVASLQTNALSTGSHSLTAVYAGDANFAGSTSNTVAQVVNQAATTTGLTSDANPSVFGQLVTFTATVSINAPGAGTPTGTVTFADGATTLGTVALSGGQASITLGTLALGTHPITATFNGTADLAGSTSAPLNQVVNQAASTTALTSDINPSIVGQSVTFTATVSAVAPGAGTPTGTVTFVDGATPLLTVALNGSGVATFTTSTLTQGTHSITASYNGSANFATSTSAPVSQVVNLAGSATSLSSNVNPSVFGQTTTFTATVTAVPPAVGTPTGTVTFTDGASVLATVALNGSGVATFTTNTLAVGTHPITATYNGDATFGTSASTPLNQVVNAGATTTTLVSNINPSVVGQSVTFTATVNVNAPASGTPTGTVTFFDGATTLGTGTLNGAGQATVSVTSLVAGSHSITATYAGDANFATSTSGPLTQTVNATATTTTLTALPNPSAFGQSVTFTATVSPVAPGAGTPTGTVTFFDGPTNLGTDTLDGSGVATLTVATLSVGTHSISANYATDGNYLSSSDSLNQVVNTAATTTTLTSDLNPSVVGQSVTFTATVTSTGTPTGTVNFFDGPTNIGSDTLDGAGVATLTTNALSGGVHPITAGYVGDGNYAGSTSNLVNQNVDAPPAVTTVAPLDGATQVPTNATLTINFDENVSIALGGVTLNCGGSVALTGLPASNVNTVILTPSTVLPAGTLCTATVLAASVTDFDAIDPPNNMAANFVWTFTTDAAPTVSFVTPSGTPVGSDASFTINFSEPVDLTVTAITLGCPGAFAFTTTPPLPATGINSIVVDPAGNLPGGATCTLTAVAAQIADSDAGDPPNNPAANAVATYTTDAAPVPTIASPANGSTQQSTTAPITVNFSENVDLTAGAVTLDCAGNIALTGLPATNVNTVTLTHSAVPEGTLCTITVVATGVTDTDAVDPPNNPTGDVTGTYTTDVAPTVQSTVPANSATNVDPTANLTVTFSEPVNFVLADFSIVCNSVAQTFTVAGTGTAIATLTPVPPLLAGASCVFTVTGAGITDTDAGDPPNSVAGNTTVNFMTAAVANDDSYNATPHLTLTISGATQGGGVTGNDLLGAAVITGFGPTGSCNANAPGATAATTLAGSVTLNLDGSFTYRPPPATRNTTDSFCYTITGGDTAAVSLGIANTAFVWFVDAAAAAGGTGTQARPFQQFGGAAGTFEGNAADIAGDTIFIRSGNYTGGVALLATQRLVGDGSGSDLATISGVTPVAGSSFPAFTGTAPVLTTGSLTDNIVLATGNTLRGLTLGDSGTAATGDSSDVNGNAFGTLTLGEMTFNGSGRTLNLTTGTVAMTGTGILNLISTASTGGGLSLNTVGGTITVAAAGATTITTTTAAATGINIVSSGATINLDDTTVTKSGTGPGVNLNADTGTITFNTLAISTTAGTALTADTCTSLVVSTAAGSTISASGGAAINSTGTGWSGAGFTSTTSSGSGTQGINLNNITGTLALGAGSITTATGTSFFGQGTLGTTSYGGSITKANDGKLVVISGAAAGTVTLSGALSCTSPCDGIDVLNRNAGTITFSNASKVLNTSTSPAVTLTSNAGATIDFTGGGLDIDTTSGTGFDATAGAAGITVQGAVNTIDATTGVALNIANSTIGANDLTFQRISSGGAANVGISLDTTGALGGLTVTGTAAVNSGGIIQNKTGADGLTTAGIGIYLNSTSSVSFNRMLLNDFSNFGIRGFNVNGFELLNSTVTSPTKNGGADIEDEGSIAFGKENPSGINGLTGIVNITNCVIEDGFENNFKIANLSGNLSQFTMTGTTIRDNFTASPGNNGFEFRVDGTANITADITTSTFTGNRANGIQVSTLGTSTGTVDVEVGVAGTVGSGGTFTNNNVGVNIAHGGPGTLNFDVHRGTFNSSPGLASPININLAAGAAGGVGLMAGFITFNTITNANSLTGPGIRVTTNGTDADGSNVLNIQVSNNNISQIGNRGIEMIARDGNSDLNATVTNNTVTLTDPLAADGIRIDSGTTAADTVSICGNITGNVSTTIAGQNGLRIRNRFAGTTFRLPAYPGAATDPDGTHDAVIAFLTSVNPATPSISADHQVGNSGFAPGGLACPTP